MRLDGGEDVTDCYGSAASFTLLECEAWFCKDHSKSTEVFVGSMGGLGLGSGILFYSKKVFFICITLKTAQAAG